LPDRKRTTEQSAAQRVENIELGVGADLIRNVTEDRAAMNSAAAAV
jgi:hypothetical protein